MLTIDPPEHHHGEEHHHGGEEPGPLGSQAAPHDEQHEPAATDGRTAALSEEPGAPQGGAPPPVRLPRRRMLRTFALVGLVVVVAASVGLGFALGRTFRAPLSARRPRTPQPPPAPSYDPGTVISPRLTAMSDPFVLQGKGVYYLYTSSGGYAPPNIPVRTFTDLRHLGPMVDAMPTLPPWTTGWTWAPDVRRIDGHYVMWFTAPDAHDVLPTGAPAKCTGVAVANAPTGPFVPGPSPVLCGAWGSIDPRTFVDRRGQLWLYWKSDSNADTAAQIPTTIWAQRLAANGITLVGPRYAVLSATQRWENGLIEAPDMVWAAGHYYLFFSANPSFKPYNGIGVATCRGPTGPCRVMGRGPLVGTSVLGQGPGEEYVWTDGSTTWLLYSPTGTGFVRRLAADRLGFGPGGPYVASFDGRSPGLTRAQVGH